jgi:hypothetical protein
VLLLRVVGLAVAAALGVLVLLYVVTGERKHLRLAWTVFRYAVFFLVLVLVILAFERLLVVVGPGLQGDDPARLSGRVAPANPAACHAAFGAPRRLPATAPGAFGCPGCARVSRVAPSRKLH